ncbi:MAG: hypothetical protein JWQ81_4443 [Amycolatopsis sp.]|uniref:hypothetical protein n=1 Tax=Amycolatopsis sp. TaxID=37632 RepID=UPI00261D5589|nr:hypothetical protein [Amycolatopsis sp.]MCU1683704.1 hypothetical protein [Amycolatopsis sp.]
MTRLSEDETEALLRDGLNRLAARARDGNEVRNALAKTESARRRPVALMLAVAAVVMVVAVGVPTIVQHLASDTMSAAMPANGLALQFRPSWLPDGFTEQYREVSPGSRTQFRRWRQGQVGSAEIALSTFSAQDPEWSGTALRMATLPDQIVVGGRVGMVSDETATSAMLTWMPNSSQVLQLKVANVPTARDAGQHIAESVRPGVTPLRCELAFGPLPPGLIPMSSLAEGLSSTDGDSGVKAATTARPTVPALRADISSRAPALQNATDVVVRRRKGLFLPPTGPDGSRVAVQLANGRWLVVSGTLTQAELVTVANAVTIDPSPDYSWIGR